VLAAAVGAEVAPLLDDPIACDDAVTELRQYSLTARRATA
jgi:hypothetical protein